MGKSVLFLIISLAVSVRTQTELCPDEDLSPCTCYVEDGRPSIRCTDIEDEDQLENIFSADFPESKIQKFMLLDSVIERLSKNVFGHVAFDEIFINIFHLSEIGEDAFKSSNETLISLEIVNAPITEYSFPFNSLGNYPLLDRLYLRSNLIVEFPTIVSESISHLTIENNSALTNIPSQVLASVPKLKRLVLGNCGIATLANDSFGGLDQLANIYLNVNNIVDIPAGLFSYLPSLLYIDLSYNNITDIESDTFGGLDQLEVINLSYNNIANIPDGLFSDLPSLYEIDLYENNIPDIESGTLSNLPTLRQLDLGHNRLQTINGSEFSNHPELNGIGLVNNKINYVAPGSFNNLPSVRDIRLSSNNLSRLYTDTFRGVNITTIYVNNNVIEYIDADAFGTVSSSIVYLNDNLLTNVHESWLQPLLDAGNFVRITENPIICDCEISWLFSDPTYQENVRFVCENGTNFVDLDPDYYAANC